MVALDEHLPPPPPQTSAWIRHCFAVSIVYHIANCRSENFPKIVYILGFRKKMSYKNRAAARRQLPHKSILPLGNRGVNRYPKFWNSDSHRQPTRNSVGHQQIYRTDFGTTPKDLTSRAIHYTQGRRRRGVRGVLAPPTFLGPGWALLIKK